MSFKKLGGAQRSACTIRTFSDDLLSVVEFVAAGHTNRGVNVPSRVLAVVAVVPAGESTQRVE